MTTLCIDEGNSSAKLGLFAGENMVKYTRLFDDWDGDLEHFLGIIKPDAVIATSTRNDETLIRQIGNHKHLLINEISQIPLKVEYETPETLGRDRVISAFAASKMFLNSHVIVINIGTCMTLDFLREDGCFLGGNIAPGMSMRLKAMHHYTARLPWVKPNNDNQLLGQSTEKAMQNGAFYGMLFEIEGFIISLRKKYNQIRVILTGGDAHYFADSLERSTIIDPFLNLKGLHLISKHYEQ